MSAFYIYFDNGIKKMMPVSSREEYIALRDSTNNRKADKMHMIQMNYSCLPNTDGSLAKTKRMSTTVGMDVDLKTPAGLSNEVETAWLKDEKARVKEQILSKKDELGLLMLEESASKGFHLVFRRHADLSQVENLKWASDLLGINFDESAKDITRVFFTPADKLIYLDDEIFKNEECKQLSDGSTTKECDGCDGCDSCDSENTKVAGKPSIVPGSLASTTYKEGFTVAEIENKYWELFNGGKQPCKGNRNDNTYKLALCLRVICDYSLETLISVIPQYDGLDYNEYIRTLKSALDQPHKGRPYSLNKVIEALRKEQRITVTGGTLINPPALPKKLPPLIELLTKNVPEPYKPAVASAVFAPLGAHLHGAKFRYWDNVEHEATFMNVLVAPQSTGKGCIKMPTEYIIKDMLERDAPNREREADWKRRNPVNKSQGKDPRPKEICIQVLTDNLTDAVFNQRVFDVENNGHRYLYLQVDEIDALLKITSRGNADGLFLIIRKAFDNSRHGQERVGSESVTGIAPLRFNWNASTTPSTLRRFFYKAVNDGTVGRLDMSTIVIDDDDFDPVYGIYDQNYAELLKPYIILLEAANGLIECPEANKLALEMKDENKDMARLSESEALRIFSYRANVISWLKGMVLYIAHGYQWSKEIEDFVRWSEHYNLWIKMKYFGEQLEEEHRKEMSIQFSSGPQNLLDLLDNDFTLDEYHQIRAQQNKAGDGDATLRKWKSRQYIDWDDTLQCYHKTDTYLNRISKIGK